MGFNRVNPSKQVVLPIEIQQNPALKKAFDDAYFIMFQMWKRMGAGDDYIDNLLTDSLLGSVKGNRDNDELIINQTSNRLDDFQFFPIRTESQKNVISTVVGITTTGEDLILCTSTTIARIVFLNSTPKQYEKTTIKRVGTQQITVNGNGKTIDGSSFKSLSTIYQLITVIYTTELDEWSIIS